MLRHEALKRRKFYDSASREILVIEAVISEEDGGPALYTYKKYDGTSNREIQLEEVVGEWRSSFDLLPSEIAAIETEAGI